MLSFFLSLFGFFFFFHLNAKKEKEKEIGVHAWVLAYFYPLRLYSSGFLLRDNRKSELNGCHWNSEIPPIPQILFGVRCFDTKQVYCENLFWDKNFPFFLKKKDLYSNMIGTAHFLGGLMINFLYLIICMFTTVFLFLFFFWFHTALM